MNKVEFEKKYNYYLKIITKQLEKISSVPQVPQKTVFEAMEYSLMAGGKRIRPIILLAVTDMLSGDIENAALVGCALECIHTYSLIHDDLPCMDNDDLRRGKPTCHKVFPENIALLAGDGLLNKAFEILSSEQIEVDDKIKIELIKCLSSSAGAFGMIGGQVIDLESENKEISLDLLLNMHKLKTGALLNASALMGCILSGVTDKKDIVYQKINEFSLNLGLAFQIKDDILDVVGLEEKLGKPIGSDKCSNKNTFVSKLSLEKAQEYLISTTNNAKDAISYFGEKGAFLSFLLDYLIEREN